MRRRTSSSSAPYRRCSVSRRTAAGARTSARVVVMRARFARARAPIQVYDGPMGAGSDQETGRVDDLPVDEGIAGTLPLAAAAAPSPAAVPPAVIGRFRVEKLLGRGAMGAVYAAFDPSLGRRVAIKVLHVRQAATPARIRLFREAQTLARFTHPNIV